MKPLFLSSIAILVLLLAACGSAAPTQPSAILPVTTSPSAATPSTQENLTRTDQQGSVVVEATPLNLTQTGDTLDFQIAMNTHMVDLSMDLAALATLTTDTGNTVQAISWDGPKGGHHVSGKLVFPAKVGGKSLLAGASQLTLTIKNVDADARVFTWSLSK